MGGRFVLLRNLIRRKTTRRAAAFQAPLQTQVAGRGSRVVSEADAIQLPRPASVTSVRGTSSTRGSYTFWG
jgi:hypothetical protein